MSKTAASNRRSVRRSLPSPAALLATAVVVIGVHLGSPADAARKRIQHGPSIVIIVLDDIGVDKISAYGEPTSPRTPNIDGLAARGIRFENAYASPLCSPTRASLLTGLLSRRTGIGTVLKTEADTFELPLDLDTLPELLGWSSSSVGKWNLSTYRSNNRFDHPNLSGFDWNAGSLGQLSTFANVGGNLGHYHLWERNKNGVPASEFVYASTKTTNDAISRMWSMGQPWFLYVAYNASHKPFHVPPASLYSGPEPTTDAARYHAAIEALDKEIGRLLWAVPSNATVILVGDNGTLKEFSASGSNRGKGSLFEEGVRVPLIIAGPGIATGIASTMAHVVDVAATVLDLSGLDWTRTDGRTLVPVLSAPRIQVRSYVYQEKFAPFGWGPYSTDDRMIRNANYKLIRRISGEEFYVPIGLDDGPDLLPFGLMPAAQAAYDELSAKLNQVEFELAAGLPLSVY